VRTEAGVRRLALLGDLLLELRHPRREPVLLLAEGGRVSVDVGLAGLELGKELVDRGPVVATTAYDREAS
jgi:hypothetical protein